MDRGADIGIIGGTGIYDPGLLEDAREVDIETPYGRPSDAFMLGTYAGRRVAFLPRHGRKHSIAPHMINYRANIWAFRELGVSRIVAPSAVGSLRDELEPGHFVLPSQFLDFTRAREGSFAEEGRVIHISVADPCCPQIQATILREASAQGLAMHEGRTYVCINGPRFSTKAESRFYRDAGADVIGMTMVPECQLAREAQICYSSIATVTDYDVWAEKPVTTKEIVRTMKENAEKAKGLLARVVPAIPADRDCQCASALAEAEF